MDSRGRADDIRLISAGAVPILSMIEHRFVHVNAASSSGMPGRPLGHRAPSAQLGLNHDAPAAEHWMQGLLAPDPSALRMSQKFPADPIYAPR
jgi:hypothetical protein